MIVNKIIINIVNTSNNEYKQDHLKFKIAHY